MGTLGKSLESVEKKEKQQFIDNVPSVTELGRCLHPSNPAHTDPSSQHVPRWHSCHNNV